MVSQLVTIYVWTIVYNIIRVCSHKISNEAKIDGTVVNPKSTILDADTENISPCSSITTIEDKSQTKDDVKHIEIECTISDRQTEVVEH